VLPSYKAIADRAGCARSTVAEALKALEWAGVLSWGSCPIAWCRSAELLGGSDRHVRLR
jgi:hypothetical protein